VKAPPAVVPGTSPPRAAGTTSLRTVDGRDADVDVDQIVAVVRATPGVASLGRGRFGEVATHLPGRTVPGVRVGDEEVEVHVVAQWPTVLPLLAANLRVALAPEIGGRSLAIEIDDIEIGE